MRFSLLAIGSPSYGLWAQNLALSIKRWGPWPIQLIYEPDAVTGIDRGVFDILTPIARDDARRGGRLNPCWAKLRLNEYFESYGTTVFLDCDAICFADPSKLFDFVAPVGTHVWGTTTQKEGVYPNMLWMRIEDMRQVFDLPDQPIPGINSSMLIYNPCDDADQVFSDAQRYYLNFEANGSGVHMARRWGRKRDGSGIYPDELFFNAALSKRDDYDAGKHIFFHTRKDGGFPPLRVLEERGYSLLGLWGNEQYNSRHIVQAYDKICSGLGLRSDSRRLIKDKFVNFN